MNRFLLSTALVLFGICFTGCVDFRTPSTAPGGIQTRNVNTTNANSQIRIWILTEEQIATPPTTKTAAESLESFVLPRLRTFTFNREAGTYYIVASNEAHYQSLTDTEPFEPSVDFSLLEVKVADKLIAFQVANTNTPTRLPQITRP
jgi:hypothetical protein